MREKLDPRNRITDAQLQTVLDGGTLWLLQPTLALERLIRDGYPAFKLGDFHGILYGGCFLALGSDRADAYLHNAGSLNKVRQAHKTYTLRRKAEIRKQLKELKREFDSLDNG